MRVILGDDVDIDVLGLQAKPTGSLLLIEEPGRPTYGTGEIEVSGGTFKAYGQDLQIERGRLLFSGPIDAPRIDIRAYRQARDGTIAGLEARGTLDAPEITLWSDPPMAQADQLSYLLLGRPVDGASQSDGDLLTKAAAALGLKGGNLLAERLGARFGLEEARIETDGGLDEASLVLGKFLTPRLYVAYGVGLFEAANTLRIRYLLSSKWTLEATTGVAAGADIFYTIERGRGAKRRVPPVQSVETPAVPADPLADEGGADADPPR
jgi:translocation and assembly module TamB